MIGSARRNKDMRKKVVRKVTNMPESNMVGGRGSILVWVMKGGNMEARDRVYVKLVPVHRRSIPFPNLKLTL